MLTLVWADAFLPYALILCWVLLKTFNVMSMFPDPLIPDSALINKQQLNHLLNNNHVNEQSISMGTRWDFHVVLKSTMESLLQRISAMATISGQHHTKYN
jgi:hypothetical protein